MSAAHTAGPWRYLPTGSDILPDEGDGYRGVQIGVEGNGGVRIAELMFEADARLIAAAPELLAALRRALFILESDAVKPWLTKDSTSGPGTLSVVLAAIAKAENRL